jgi:hypothetical protein
MRIRRRLVNTTYTLGQHDNCNGDYEEVKLKMIAMFDLLSSHEIYEHFLKQFRQLNTDTVTAFILNTKSKSVSFYLGGYGVIMKPYRSMRYLSSGANSEIIMPFKRVCYCNKRPKMIRL